MRRYARYGLDDDGPLGGLGIFGFSVVVLMMLMFSGGCAERQQRETNRAVCLVQEYVEQYARQHNGRYPLTTEIVETLPDSVRLHLRRNPYSPWKPITINSADLNNGDLSYASDGTSYEIIGYGWVRLARAASDSLGY